MKPSCMKLVGCAWLATCGVASNAAVTGISGASQPQTTIQPSLGINYLVRTRVANTANYNELGEVILFGGNFAPDGWQLANGQLLTVAQNDPLFSALGTTYGGDGRTTFALPDLRGRVAIGTGSGVGLSPRTLGERDGVETVTLSTANLPAHSHTLPAGGNTANTGAGVSYTNLQPSLALNFQIALQGIFPLQSGGLVVDTAPLIATIRMKAGNQTSPAYSSAQGQLMAIGPNQTLFTLLGTTFGGDGRTSFSLPNLSGRAVLGAGAAPGLTPHDLGESAGVESVSLSTSQLPPHVHTLPGGGTTGIEGAGQSQTNMQPTLALHYIIATEGPYPSQNTGGAADEAPFLGQIDLFAGNFAPSGWAFTDGQMLPITLNSALFSLLGTTFGGDGVSMFALPDLRDRVAVGAGSGVGLSPWDTGQQTGTESLVLLTDQMPAHDHAFTPVPEPASVYVLAAASTLFLLGCRRHRAVQSNDA